MKTFILLTILSAFAITSFAQKIDTNKKVKLSQAEIWDIAGRLNVATEKIHKLEMSALKRDTLDNILIPWVNEIRSRYEKAKPDTSKKK
jgi:hypothetical protein